MKLFSFFTLFVSLVSSANFRAPAVPLAVSTPFFSVWSYDAGNLAGQQTLFWNGNPNTLDSLIKIDNITYVLMGVPTDSSLKVATQLGYPKITATTSLYSFTAGGVSITLRFTTPQLPSNMEAMARPANYIEWTVVSNDNNAHSVQIYYDQSGETVCNDPTQLVEWIRPTVDVSVLAMRIGQVGQTSASYNISARMRNSTEPHQQQDFGFAYLLVDKTAPSSAGMSSVLATASAAQSAFVSTGTLPGPSGDATPPAPVAAPLMVAAASWNLGSVSTTPVSCRAIFMVDEGASILFYDTLLAPYWRRNYTAGDFTVVPAVPMLNAITEADSILAACDAFDSQIAAETLAAGGSNYSAVAQLTYRQVFGANGVAWNGTDIWIFQKEISSDGDLSTLDVLFPSAPQPLAFPNADMLAYAIAPALYLMGPESPVKFSQNCAFHSMGKWPVVDLGNGGCSMPLESTGDIVLMTAGVVQARNGSMDVAEHYMPLFRKYVGFLQQQLPFPPFQDMTDDFSHAPGNLTNLALKGILSLGAIGYFESLVGNTSGAQALYAMAQQYGDGFVSMGFVQGPPSPHFKFIYNDTWDDSYGLMYNALWARLLGLEWIIPNFYPLFNTHYQFLSTITTNATWCPPLSSMEHDSKWDWLVNTASLMFSNASTSVDSEYVPPAPTAWSNQVFDQLYFFANTTSSRFPLTDHPECTGPFPPAAAADRARPVLGAFYGPVLVANPPPSFTHQHHMIHEFAVENGLI